MADEPKGKSFYLVTAMSEAFRKFDESLSKTDMDGVETMQQWNNRISLAAAQQLCNIAEELKRLNQTLMVVKPAEPKS